MALKKKSSGGGGANWMDTYGDMVTLLLCFFVLLYSMSTISTENWKAIVMSFNPSAIQTPTATTGAGGPDADHDAMGGEMPQEQVNITQEDVDNDIERLFQAIQEYVDQQNQQNNISVKREDGKVYISFGDTVFFDGDSSYLRREARPILGTISGMLSEVADSIDEVRVVGHTAQGNPDKPNDVQTDRTLSSMRATNVVIFVQENSRVEPGKLVSEGIGQWRPVATNRTSEGRAQNRRVEMIISGRNLEMEAAAGTTVYATQ